MKSNNNNIITKLFKLFQEANTSALIWSLVAAVFFAFIILYKNYQLRNKARNPIKSQKSSCNPNNNSNDNDSCIHLNNCLKWLYFSNETTNRINLVLLKSLGELQKSLPKQNELSNEDEIVFTSVETLPPSLKNIRTEINNSKDNLTFKSNFVLSQVEFKVNIKNTKTIPIQNKYIDLKIVDLIGEFLIVFTQNKSKHLFDIECSIESISDVKLRLQEQPENVIDSNLLKHLEDVILSAIKQMKFKLEINLSNEQLVTNVTLDDGVDKSSDLSHLNSLYSPKNITNDSLDKYDINEKRLLVKLIKATNLTNCEEPYCVIELDHPLQKHITNVFKDLSSVDEQFLFDITPHSEEISFSVFDRNKDYGSDMIGEAVVLVSDLLNNLSSKRVIQLHKYGQTKTGSVTAEFLFIESTGVTSTPRQNSNKSNMSTTQRQKNDNGRIPQANSNDTITTVTSNPLKSSITLDNSLTSSNIVINPLYDNQYYNHVDGSELISSTSMNSTDPQMIYYTNDNNKNYKGRDSFNDSADANNDTSINSNSNRVINRSFLNIKTNLTSPKNNKLMNSSIDINNASFNSNSLMNSSNAIKHKSLSRSLRNLFHLPSSDKHKKKDKRDTSNDSSIIESSLNTSTTPSKSSNNLNKSKTIGGSLKKLFSKKSSAKGRVITANVLDSQLKTNSLSTDSNKKAAGRIINYQDTTSTLPPNIKINDDPNFKSETPVIRKGFRLP